MKRAAILFGAIFVWMSVTSPAVLAQDDEAKTVEAQQSYEKLVDTYMYFEPDAWNEALKGSYKHHRDFSLAQRKNISYMRRAATEYRPTWWSKTKSSTGITFAAQVWGKRFAVKYMPSEHLGASGILDFDEQGRPQVAATWQPHLVDSKKPLGGDAAKAHQMREGDEAEAIVWHELGHCYITANFNLEQLYALYVDYNILYKSLHEFFADLTALHHCSPPGRKATLLIRISEVAWNDVNDPHVRGALGIGSYMLATILSEPEKWPNFHLPNAVPETDPERKCILYMYEHLDPHYTFEEDCQLRDLAGDLVKKHGSSIFRSKGTIKLPNGLEYKMTTSEDRDSQIQRDKWVAERLKKAIEEGTINKVSKTLGHPKRFRLRTTW
jgi:hypothetical protein